MSILDEVVDDIGSGKYSKPDDIVTNSYKTGYFDCKAGVDMQEGLDEYRRFLQSISVQFDTSQDRQKP